MSFDKRLLIRLRPPPVCMAQSAAFSSQLADCSLQFAINQRRHLASFAPQHDSQQEQDSRMIERILQVCLSLSWYAPLHRPGRLLRAHYANHLALAGAEQHCAAKSFFQFGAQLPARPHFAVVQLIKVTGAQVKSCLPRARTLREAHPNDSARR